MADRTISVELLGRDRSLSSALGGAGDEAERTGSRIGKAAKGIGVALGAAGAVGGGLFAAGVAGNMNIEVANDKLAAQLGLSTAEAKKAGEVAGEVYGNNWGSSIEDVNAAIKSVGDNLGDVGKLSKAELQGMTESALALASTFEVDVNEATMAAGRLVKNGLAKDSKEAFDIITYGMQNGINASGDFLATLEEYSPQFSKLGIKGKDVLGVLDQFMKAGARNTDVAADAFKEFSLISIDGAESTIGAYKALGLNGKAMGKQIADGGKGASDGLATVVEKLQGIKDKQKQNEIGVALFGTMWEDTVRTVLPKLDLTKKGVEGVDGATQRMADTVGDNAQGRIDTLKRGFEQWTQKMASSEGTMGTIVTGFTAFGGGALEAGSQIGILALAFKGLGAALLLNPIGIVITVLALLVVGLVALWKNSQEAREKMSAAFAGISNVVLTAVGVLLKAYQAMANGVLSVVETTLRALGKIPGNDWADRAADDVKGFRDDTNKFFNGAIAKTEDWRRAANRLPKEIKLKGEISDLKSKINTAKARLKTVPKSQRAALRADIQQLKDRVQEAKRSLASIPKFVRTTVNTKFTTTGTRTAPSEFRAKGGPVLAGRAYVVGEKRAELFVPDGNGTIIPEVPASGGGRGRPYTPGFGGGGGDTYNIYVTEPLGTPSQIGDAIVRALERRPAGSRRIPAAAVSSR